MPLFHDIHLDELRAKQRKQALVLIDVRSPGEFNDATIPGSVNIPLFDDAERAEIGTLYKQTGMQAAKERGLEIVSAKLPTFIKTIGQIDAPKAVFCWRGGMRSKTTATLLSLMGIHTFRLIGGYRAYRKWVVETLDGMTFRPRALVIHGNTGSGKTALLQQLKAQGYPVLDLEALAGHRGSVFGQIGLKPHNQKTFDAALLEQLLQLQDSPYVIMEAESRRIGKVVIPEFLMQKKEEGIPIWIEMSVPARVEQILHDYRPWEYKEQYLNAFKQIKSRIHTPIAAEIEANMQADRFAPAVELLLNYYYDPRYAHTTNLYAEKNGIELTVHNAEEAVEAMKACIDRQIAGELPRV